MSAVADKLDEARALIEARGLAKGEYRDTCGRLCVYGAVNLAVTGDAENDWSAKTDEPLRVLASVVRCNPSKLHEWNDRKCRTQAEVIEAFRKAAELARAADAQPSSNDRERQS